MKTMTLRIKPGGNYTTELNGFENASCATATQSLEVLLGGRVVEEEKKPEFFNSDGEQPVMVKL